MSNQLQSSRALWNRNAADLESAEVLAQILDRGSLEDWRELYRLAENDASLRRRLVGIVRRVPLPLPYFWLALLARLGEPVSFDDNLPDYGSTGT